MSATNVTRCSMAGWGNLQFILTLFVFIFGTIVFDYTVVYNLKT